MPARGKAWVGPVEQPHPDPIAAVILFAVARRRAPLTAPPTTPLAQTSPACGPAALVINSPGGSRGGGARHPMGRPQGPPAEPPSSPPDRRAASVAAVVNTVAQPESRLRRPPMSRGDVARRQPWIV